MTESAVRVVHDELDRVYCAFGRVAEIRVRHQPTGDPAVAEITVPVWRALLREFGQDPDTPTDYKAHFEGVPIVPPSRDVIVTWPKSRAFGSYMIELERAKAHGHLINFRVAQLPRLGVSAFDYGAPVIRCYRVYDGHVRGWVRIYALGCRGEREVMRVGAHDAAPPFWPSGNYIVCDPEWHALQATPLPELKGFRGWRWFDRID